MIFFETLKLTAQCMYVAVDSESHELIINDLIISRN